MKKKEKKKDSDRKLGKNDSIFIYLFNSLILTSLLTKWIKIYTWEARLKFKVNCKRKKMNI